MPEFFVLPQQLLAMPQQHRRIVQEGVTIIESCHHQAEMRGSAVSTQLEMIHLLSGRLVFQHGELAGTLEAGETALVDRALFFDYIKQRQADGTPYSSVLFFLREDFLRDFVAQFPLPQLAPAEGTSPVGMIKISASPLISNFMASLLPYFDSPLGQNAQLLKIKTYELLLNLAEGHPALFQWLLQRPPADKPDLAQVLEQHYTKNLSLTAFAHLAGRSLAAFKRDFERIFNQTPARWLKERRLKLAHHLLAHTQKQVSEIALEVGFEDYSHFTRSFKAQYGLLPSQARG
ncbi:MAG: AraC family transcriptional regulator [Bernardetiaceae bacterium]|nr:AraC family transcriptional regulator [Bernardetiaceae bacterium]